MNFKTSTEEAAQIDQLVNRAAGMITGPVDKCHLATGLTACHCNGCPLDLEGLLSAEKQDILHDAAGICQNLNLKTGKLENCFWPRFAKGDRP